MLVLSFAGRPPASGDIVVGGLQRNTVLQRLKLTGKAALVTGEVPAGALFTTHTSVLMVQLIRYRFT
jgi:hypothetical protein